MARKHGFNKIESELYAFYKQHTVYFNQAKKAMEVVELKHLDRLGMASLDQWAEDMGLSPEVTQKRINKYIVIFTSVTYNGVTFWGLTDEAAAMAAEIEEIEQAKEREEKIRQGAYHLRQMSNVDLRRIGTMLCSFDGVDITATELLSIINSILPLDI